jgi:uncharacterized protein with PQ loop repeat
MRQQEVHHLHVRKRIHVEHQKYPHPNKFVRRIDQLICFVSIVFPLTLVPQIVDIFVSKNVAALSLTTWILSLVLGIPMLIYAFVHKIKPIIIMNILWIIMYCIIIAGILIYT